MAVVVREPAVAGPRRVVGRPARAVARPRTHAQRSATHRRATHRYLWVYQFHTFIVCYRQSYNNAPTKIPQIPNP